MNNAIYFPCRYFFTWPVCDYSLGVREWTFRFDHVFGIAPSLQMLKEGPDQDILIESFLSLGRVDHLTMVMALHPFYLSCFLKTQHALFELDGPLPRHWRHYIAVMVRKSQMRDCCILQLYDLTNGLTIPSRSRCIFFFLCF